MTAVIVATARPSERAEFIRKTYTHLSGAIGAFIVLEFLLFQTRIAYAFTALVAGSQVGWLLVLGAFALLGWFSRSLAAKADDPRTQYVGLGIYVVAEAIIFAPLLVIASVYAGGQVIATAGIATLSLFAGLTAIVFTTKKDFSFLGSVLTIGGFIALALILCGIFFGLNLGVWFSIGMIIFATGAILYDTSNVLHHYTTDQYVAASLELFASVALLFWYVLRLMMQLSRR